MIRVGVAGWDYPDWAGIVYPTPLPKGFDRLGFLAGFFDTIEINVTFYRQVEPAASASWVSRAPSRNSFAFTAKLYRALTHGGGPPANPEGTEVDVQAEARAFLGGIAPLRAGGRLGAVLMQFPQGFHDRPASRSHLGHLVEMLPGLPLVAEFRHRSWDNEGALAFLKERGVGFCNIDQPSLPSTLPPTAHVTSRIAYVRLHGRNAGSWFARRPNPADGDTNRRGGSARYDYFYSMAELRPWIGRIRSLEGRAEEVFIIANNHYRGKGPANALMVKSALESRRVQAPADLIAAHPDLEAAAEPAVRPARTLPRQRRLF